MSFIYKYNDFIPSCIKIGNHFAVLSVAEPLCVPVGTDEAVISCQQPQLCVCAFRGFPGAQLAGKG